MTNLKPAGARDDGKPWVPWQTGNEYLAALPGHKERVELSAWYDRDRQSLVLTITQYDESMSEYIPCWAQLALVDVGPFFAEAEVHAFVELFTETILTAWDVCCPPE